MNHVTRVLSQMDKLQSMSIFVSVVEAGGFAKAARLLDLSPPVVTRAVADLEATVGVRLLTRNTRVVRVTEPGAAYAQECKSILAAVQNAEARALGEASSVKGGLRITAPVTFGQMYLTPILAEYLGTWPEADLTCFFLDRVVNLVEEGFDAAIRIGPLPDSSLIASKVGSVRRVLIASPAYLNARGCPQSTADLKNHSLISTAALGEEATWYFGSGEHRHNIVFRPRLRSSTVLGSMTAAIHGTGIAQLLSYQVADSVASGKLRIILENSEGSREPVNVVYAETRQRTFKLRSFVDLVVERLRDCPALR